MIGGSLIELGNVQLDNERARMLYLEAGDVARACGHTEGLAAVAANLGEIAYEEGALESARTYSQRALELYGELADAGGEAVALVNLALVALAEGDIDEATAFLVSSLRLAKKHGDKPKIYFCLVVAAEVAAHRGETARAARLLGASDALSEEMGLADTYPEQKKQRARIESVLDGDDAAQAAQAEGRALTLEEAVAYALGDRG